MKHLSRALGLTTIALSLMVLTPTGHAAEIYWTDWTGTTSGSGYNAVGTITTSTASVDVAYHHPIGIGFAQFSGGTDYYQNDRSGRNPATSPYTSAGVDNIPTGTDIIALRYAGTQTLAFSEPVANLVFSYVSLNGNGYAFDQDFEILSFGHSIDGNDCGYWGCGTSYKNVVDLGNGQFEYQLLGTGEPHGTVRFLGAFDTVSWRSMSNEYWNGFTVGVAGTAAEVDTDEDDDGVLDVEDNCPVDSNPDQADGDADGLGDVCDPFFDGVVDTDGDGIADDEDNCPLDWNPDQEDLDADSAGDVCDGDADGDGVVDAEDLCLGTAASDIAASVPSKGLGKNRWADVDGDGFFDTNGKNPTGRYFSLEDTGGCSCAQIIDACGYGAGHMKFGCSNSDMDWWTGLYDQAGQEPFQCKAD